MKAVRKKVNTTDKKLSMAERFPRNIPIELFDAFQLVRREGDAAILCEKLDVSRPIIDRLLNYGHTKKPSLANRVKIYFQDRMKKEKVGGVKIIKKETSK